MTGTICVFEHCQNSTIEEGGIDNPLNSLILRLVTTDRAHPSAQRNEYGKHLTHC